MTVATIPRSPDPLPLTDPARSGGMRDLVRRRYLLRLLVRRELRSRYQGSLLGLGWSYVRPAVNFAVYYFIVGIFLGLGKNTENLPIYLFAGMVVINVFTETMITSTWSVVGNAALVKKIYLPRELFPFASFLVSAVNMLPALLILWVGAAVAGWRPSLLAVTSLVLALAIIALLSTAVALLFSGINVYFRDFGQVVDILGLLIPWSVPMIYPWSVVRDYFGAGSPMLEVYLANPLAVAVSLFQRAFWWPTTDGPAHSTELAVQHTLPFPEDLTYRGLYALAASLLLFGLAQFAFGRLQRRFAQEL
jgi:ABC-2 type transport system permease protein